MIGVVLVVALLMILPLMYLTRDKTDDEGNV